MLGVLLIWSSAAFIAIYGVIHEPNRSNCMGNSISTYSNSISDSANGLCDPDPATLAASDRLSVHSVLPEGRDGIHPEHRQRLHPELLFEVQVYGNFQ
jgi:hypothetical protein